MNATAISLRQLSLLNLIALLVLAACRPPVDFHITPSPTPTPEPTATPTPTPLPANYIDPGAANQNILDALLALLPASIAAGEEEWKRDYSRGQDGFEDVLGIRGTAAGKQIYYRTQEGGQMSFYFVIFDTPEEAAANYERILGIRSVLENGKTNEDFPQPNIFGSGLYGSVSIFQIENYFIEVNIELFTRGSPLVPLSRGAIRFFENNRAEFEAAATANAPDSGSDVLQIILDNLPREIFTDTQWRRDYSRFDGVETPPNVQNGEAARVFYRDQAANVFNMTFGRFDRPADANAHYERLKGIREGIEDENTIEEFPKPHVLGRGLYGSVALFAIDEFFIEVLMERAPGTSANPTVAIARKALQLLEDARSGALD